MFKRNVSKLIVVAMITNLVATPVSSFANTLNETDISQHNQAHTEENKKIKISKFNLYGDRELQKYNDVYKVDNSKIVSIINNGGKYGNSTIDKAVDNNLSTHWETGRQNSSTFTNEVVVTFDEITELSRVVYAARQDGAKGKGFAQEVEVYSSLTDKEDDFKLVGEGSYNGSITDIVELKFNNTEFKRIKFVFKKAYSDWASASEFMFYKEDNIIDKMNNIFTNGSKNELSEEFNTIEKLESFDLEAKPHPLYSKIEEDINNARIILENKKLEFVNANVNNFKDFEDKRLAKYDELFKVKSEDISNIVTNGGHYGSSYIEKAIDEDKNTSWHSGKQNTSSHTNEIIITLDELTTIDRIMYTNTVSRGFPQEFEIYASRTSKGDTFEKISEGTTDISVNKTLQIQFKETELRRIKFVFKKGYENWAIASEIGLYKPDELNKMMDILFIDDNMKEVNQEFANIGTIEKLIEQAKEHPFRDEYIEKLNIAKELVEFGNVQSGSANVSKFEPFYTDYINKYDETYRVNNLKISNNGRHYGGSVINNAIDNNADTYWETGRPNSGTFINEVMLTLEEAETINRLTYKARAGVKGFAQEFSIYISPVASGDNFQKVTSGGYTVTSDMIEIKFNPAKAKRVKFVFDKAYQNWASISDIRLYREDIVSDKISTMFENGLMNSLSEDFNSIEKLNQFENEVSGHPLENIYLKDIQRAKDILNGTLQTVKTVVAEQHGDRDAHANKNLKFGFGNNNQPTGVVARAGQEITVYVDAQPGDPLPQLVFSQQEGSFASWGRSVSLHIGKNVITVPQVTQNDGWYHHSVTPGGAVYIVNPYTPEQQSKAPSIRFESGCERFPMMDKNTDEKEFLELLKEYALRVEEDKKSNPNVMDRKMIDVVEISSDHLVFTGTATAAYDVYINKKFSPMNTVNMYNNHMDMVFEYYGLDGSSEKNDIKHTRENIRLAQPFGYMYAGAGHIGVQRDVMAGMLTSVGSWGVDHEMGHKLDVAVRCIGEVTNNMIPQNSSYYYNRPNKRIPFESHIYKNVLSTNSNKYYSGEFFENLAVFWQLEMIYPGYWGKLNKQYRENNIVLDSNNASLDKLNQLAKYSSIALELDLSEHFERHGFWVSDDTKTFLKKYPKPDIKTWYANYDYIEYKGQGFNGNPGLSVDIVRSNENIELLFNVNSDSVDDVLGYEIFKDGKLIGFTSNDRFTYKEDNKDKAAIYTVIPYDKKLNVGQAVEINSLTPTLSVQQEFINIRLGEEFNPLDLVKAVSYNGDDIKSKIIVNGEVDTNKKGNYKVEFTIEDSGISLSKSINVEVVSSYNYLSDIEWNSVQTQSGRPRRNSNITGRVNGEVKKFEKGFGIHANGKIVYDLSNVECDTFEALVGVDMSIGAQSNSSIVFKVIGDGKVLSSTDIINHEDNMRTISADISGVKELVIEVNDAGNGNTSDHGIIANPKLISNNAKPLLNVIDKEYKLGEAVDFNSGITATDIEDGDLTSNIQIISNNYKEGKLGRFEVVYRVTDSDNNITEKTSYITIYEEIKAIKSKYGQFNNLEEYNSRFKLPVVSVHNNGGNYGQSFISYSVDNNRNTHWETGKPNGAEFKNEVIFDLGKITEIDKIAYAARNSGKGFASKFEIYVSTDEQGDDFRLLTSCSYDGSINDVIEIDISKTSARRVKFKFIEAYQNWASIGEISFYKTDEISNKILNDLFINNEKTAVSEKYNSLEKLDLLREEVKSHPAAELFEADLKKAEEVIRYKFPTLNIPKSQSTKVGQVIDIAGGYSASDIEDGDLTSSVKVIGNVDFNKAGEYTITYEVSDSDGNKVVKTREISVVDMNDFKYLTDYKWNSTSNSYTSPKVDISISNRMLRLTGEDMNEVCYERGIGAHSTSTIIYDLSDKNYDYFTSYVGVDRQMYGTVGSVSFEVWVDGKKEFDSGLMGSRDIQKYVEIDINDAKELKLVVRDGGNGNGSDHATWGDAKLHYAKSN